MGKLGKGLFDDQAYVSQNLIPKGDNIIDAGAPTSRYRNIYAANIVADSVSAPASRVGNATLVAGTVTVLNTTVTVDTVISLTRKTVGGTVGDLSYTVSPGVSFTINSTSALDTSVVSYLLTEQA